MTIKSGDSANRQDDQEVGNASGPAPPSYAAVTSGQSPAPQTPYPQITPYPQVYQSHQTHLRTPGALEQGIYASQSQSHSHPFDHPGEVDGWTPPQTEREAAARTRKRFLVACLWGFGIYALIGLLLGGGFEDSSTTTQDRNRDRQRERHRQRQGQSDPDRPSIPGERVDPNHPSRTWKHVDRATKTVVDVEGMQETVGVVAPVRGIEGKLSREELEVEVVRGILEAIEAKQM